MYLINVRTLKLEEFSQTEVPPYAILSHVWGPQELNFKDVLKNRAHTSSRGYRKLREAAYVAGLNRLYYLWIDTCCIDKRSSAELSEAINSMYAWYEKSDLCIAYLEDVGCKDCSVIDQEFRRSAWFTRTWTKSLPHYLQSLAKLDVGAPLQELIAPRQLKFFDTLWTNIGDRDHYRSMIEEITGIPNTVLTKDKNLTECSIAQKMSWAAKRRATREEDLTYSLLGIFDVNMPLLYGEGHKAFVRLQELLIPRTKDPTLLLWGLNHDNRHYLAKSPSDFEGIGEILPCEVHTPLTLSSIGLAIETRLVRWGIETYGLVLGTIPDVAEYGLQQQHPTAALSEGWLSPHFVLLVRKHRTWASVTRMGVRMASINWWGCRTRLLTIKGDDYRTIVPSIHTFALQVRVGPSVSIRDVITGPRPAKFDSDLSAHDGLCCFEHEFGDTETDSFLVCQVSRWSLQIELYFDFDCNVCAFIYNNDDLGQRPPLWEISTDAEAMNREHHMMRGGSGRSDMIEMLDGRAAFLRTSNYCIWAQVPTKFGFGGTPLWISIFSPYFLDNKSRFWSVRITDVRPEDFLGQLLEV